MAKKKQAATARRARAPTPVAPSSKQQAELPEDVVVCILRQIPLQQRLRCALVCRAWAAAAAKVPAVVICSFNSSEHCEQLQHWLDKPGRAVGAMHCASKNSWPNLPLLQLPIPKLTLLRNLQLLRIKAQRLADAAAVATTVLPRLQKLGLRQCHLTVQLASQLLSTTTLTQLQWDSVRLHMGNWTEAQGLDVLWQQLQLLPNLSVLHCSWQMATVRGTSADITPVSNLQHLQRLSLESPFSGTDQSDPRALLAALQPLTQLQHLELNGCQLHLIRPPQAVQQQADSYQCFSALTASTQLTALVLAQHIDVVVPQEAFGHMFPAGRTLPELQVLRLDCTDRSADQHCVEAAQVAMIGASTPALQKLGLSGVTPEGFNTSCLAQLPPGVTRVEGLDWVRPAP